MWAETDVLETSGRTLQMGAMFPEAGAGEQPDRAVGPEDQGGDAVDLPPMRDGLIPAGERRGRNFRPAAAAARPRSP
jgi:hypothetical protein